MSDKTTYVWSTNQQDFSHSDEFDSIDECLLNARLKHLNHGVEDVEVFVGEKTTPELWSYFDMETYIDYVMCQDENNHDHAEFPHISKETERHIEEDIQRILRKHFNERGISPNWFNVVIIKQYVV